MFGAKRSLKEAPPDCDMLLVHDDDLAQLHGIYDSTVSSALGNTLLY